MRILNSMQIPKLKIEKTYAQLNIQSRPASCEVDVEKNGLEMKSEPFVVQIDNSAFYDSIGLKTVETFTAEFAQSGKDAAMSAAERYCKEAKIYLDGGKSSDIAYMRTQKSIESMLIFIPEEKPKFSFKGGDVNRNYTPDKYTYIWDTGGVSAEYLPYSVNISVEE
ncbi:MAG: DUF6470 family protein [Clostridiales bacterium]|nr:DUF6470 family protein [Clostridiales bacterium]